MKNFILLLVLLVSPVLLWATPPTAIFLNYDKLENQLKITAEHPSFNLVKSYVRLVYVYSNGSLVLTRNYFRQNDYQEFKVSLPLQAKPGDVIKVELFCTLGGSLSEEIKI